MRCKICGMFKGIPAQCMEMTESGPVFHSEHAWEAEAPRTGSAPANYLTAEAVRPTSGQYLTTTNRPSIEGNSLNAERRFTSKNIVTADIRSRMGLTSSYESFHQKVIRECAPICRKVALTEFKQPSMLPSQVRSGRPVPVKGD